MAQSKTKTIAEAKSAGLRTPSGGVAQAARDKYALSDGRFPIFDAQSFDSAMQLRGHDTTPAQRAEIVSNALAWATANGDTARAMRARLAQKQDAQSG